MNVFGFHSAKIQKEIDAVVAPGQMISGEDRKKLPYTNAVIHEVQRFSNIIAVGLPRLCVKDTMIRQFTIKRVSEPPLPTSPASFKCLRKCSRGLSDTTFSSTIKGKLAMFLMGQEMTFCPPYI